MHAPDPPADLAVDLAGTTVWLLPERALWWPEGAMLCLADLHLGKAATFRARGLPVPAGTTQGNLDRLAQLLARHPGVQRLVVLGDFLHAAEANAPALLRALAAWREDHAALELVLGRGNQQISSRLLRAAGKRGLHVLAPRDKLLSLHGGVLRIDSGDAQLDAEFNGYLPVMTGYREQTMWPVSV